MFAGRKVRIGTAWNETGNAALLELARDVKKSASSPFSRAPVRSVNPMVLPFGR